MTTDKLGFFEYKEVIYGFFNEPLVYSLDEEKLEELLFSLWESYHHSDIKEISIKRDAKVFETVLFYLK